MRKDFRQRGHLDECKLKAPCRYPHWEGSHFGSFSMRSLIGTVSLVKEPLEAVMVMSRYEGHASAFPHFSPDSVKHLRYSSAHRFDTDEDTSSDWEYEYTVSDDSDDGTSCYKCNRNFVDQAALNQHFASNPNHNWCFVCSRDFSSPQALAQVRFNFGTSTSSF